MKSENLRDKFNKQFPELAKWITDSIFPSTFPDHVYIEDIIIEKNTSLNKLKKKCIFSLFTDNYQYSFTAGKPYSEEPKGYIIGEVSLRKPIAGEKYSGSRTLPGAGIFSEETWINLIKGMMSFELVKLSPNVYLDI